MWVIFKLFYFLLSFQIQIDIAYTHYENRLLNIFIVFVILNILASIIQIVVYHFTGWLFYIGFIDSDKMQVTHWFFRCFVFFIIFLLSFTPFLTWALSPLVNAISTYFIYRFSVWIDGLQHINTY